MHKQSKKVVAKQQKQQPKTKTTKKRVTKIAKRNLVTKKTTVSSALQATSPAVPQFQSVAPFTTQSAPFTHKFAPLAAKITRTTTQQQFAPLTLSTASFSSPAFNRSFKVAHPLEQATQGQFQSKTGLPSHLSTQLSQVSFLPVNKVAKRSFFGKVGEMMNNAKAAAQNAAAAAANPAAMQAGMTQNLGQMMEMMEMMKAMQKITNMVKNGTPSEAEYQEILAFIEKIRTTKGGQLAPEVDQMLQKLQNRQPISQDEVMTILGLTPAEAAELREITIGVKNGSVNQMTYMMKIAETFQRAQQRKEAAKQSSTDATTKIEN